MESFGRPIISPLTEWTIPTRLARFGWTRGVDRSGLFGGAHDVITSKRYFQANEKSFQEGIEDLKEQKQRLV